MASSIALDAPATEKFSSNKPPASSRPRTSRRVGYAGRIIERSIATYGKAHHLTLPNIEYVLWAIVIGLVIGNTVGVPKLFQAGVATYEFWLKDGHRPARLALPAR